MQPVVWLGLTRIEVNALRRALQELMFRVSPLAIEPAWREFYDRVRKWDEELPAPETAVDWEGVFR